MNPLCQFYDGSSDGMHDSDAMPLAQALDMVSNSGLLYCILWFQNNHFHYFHPVLSYQLPASTTQWRTSSTVYRISCNVDGTMGS